VYGVPFAVLFDGSGPVDLAHALDTAAPACACNEPALRDEICCLRTSPTFVFGFPAIPAGRRPFPAMAPGDMAAGAFA